MQADLISVPPHVLLILEERLKEQGVLAPDADVTELALRILAIVRSPARPIPPGPPVMRLSES